MKPSFFKGKMAENLDFVDETPKSTDDFILPDNDSLIYGTNDFDIDYDDLYTDESSDIKSIVYSLPNSIEESDDDDMEVDSIVYEWEGASRISEADKSISKEIYTRRV